ncbi:MAG: exodeoxyribonuclease VII large subunit, partial [Spirochaetales bacterium]|nr:exodeoxyribonuclease VII large subunit [Spirochaetales bacterium]
MDTKEYISVSELTDILKVTLEKVFNHVYLRGEISGYRPSSSGHCYFTLKDADATISAVIFRFKLPQIMSAFHEAGLDTIENGQEVLIEGNLSLYKKGGSYSIVVEKMVPAGLGSLFQKFEQLKKKLESEGLFDSSVKKAIPEHAERIGVVTSPTGAALQDVLNVLKRRSPQTKVVVFPTAVQGDDAKYQIAKAIRYADSQYRKKG